jgi:hypothetical protein
LFCREGSLGRPFRDAGDIQWSMLRQCGLTLVQVKVTRCQSTRPGFALSVPSSPKTLQYRTNKTVIMVASHIYLGRWQT